MPVTESSFGFLTGGSDHASVAQLEANLKQAEAANDSARLAAALIALASRESDLGRNSDALPHLVRALGLEQSTEDHRTKCVTLYLLGVVYDALGRKQEALDSLNSALAPAGRDDVLLIEILDETGMVLYMLGRPDAAQEKFGRALHLAEELDNGHNRDAPVLYASTLYGRGLVAYTRGDEENALDYLNRALLMQRTARYLHGQAATLSALGLVYTYLGQQRRALARFQSALALEKELGDLRAAAIALNNIGWTYDAMGRKQQALSYLNQALPIQKQIKDLAGESYTLDSIGLVYRHLGQNESAVETYASALHIERQVGDRDCEGNSLWGLGETEQALGQPGDALRDELAARSLAVEVGDSDLEGRVDSALMNDLRAANHPETAIFFGMDAVNQFQQVRRNISGLGRDVQAGFVQSRSQTYRQLAEVLVETNQLGKAEQVLDLLKEQELREVLRGAQPDAVKTEPLPLNQAQRQAENDLHPSEQQARTLVELNAEYEALIARRPRTTAEDDRLIALRTQLEAGNRQVYELLAKDVFPKLESQLGNDAANRARNDNTAALSALQSTLRELGPRVMGVRLLFGTQHVYAIVVTGKGQRYFQLQTTPAELKDKVLRARDELRSLYPSVLLKPHLEELYQLLVAPMEQELSALERQPPDVAGRAPTILWSLDGVLRYLPMAALYDGHHYLVERVNNVLFTPESYAYMNAAALAGGHPRALAMGLSKPYGGLRELPGVVPELDAVVRDPSVPASHGPIQGSLLLNDKFTLAALRDQLEDAGPGAEPYSIVHIASHFVLPEDSGEDPYLMTGGEDNASPDGFRWTITDVSTSTISFHGVKLLTLSACSTAKGDAVQGGMEIESLGMVAQQKEAEAVLATLWDVNDASTSSLMSDFYTRWMAHAALGKAEALRQAQLQFLHQSAAAPSPAAGRGFKSAQSSASSARDPGYTNPFYWAPYVLIGNFK